MLLTVYHKSNLLALLYVKYPYNEQPQENENSLTVSAFKKCLKNSTSEQLKNIIYITMPL